MNDGVARRSRRQWLAHCTASACAAGLALVAPAHAQGARKPGTLILVVGDSLSAEYGLKRGAGWVALLRQHRPDVVVLELGGNDALRGLPLAMTRDNLDAMAKAAKAVGAKVVIAGMQLPPNYGRQYGDQFASLFSAVATAEGTALVPFLLKGVADGPRADAMFQPDRIHPLASAHPAILDNVWPVLEPLLNR